MIFQGNKAISRVFLGDKEITRIFQGTQKVFDNKIDSNNLLAYYNGINKTNQDPDRATWKDLTGNGYDLQLNNFVFGGLSGWGGYLQNFNDSSKWVAGGNISNKTDNSFTITAATSVMGALIYILSASVNVGDVINMNFEASGIPDGVNLYFGYASTTAVRFPIVNGVNNMSFVVPLTGNIGFRSEQIFSDANIVIKQIPEHANALVFDGIDDFAQSIINLPAFAAGNYTFVLDFETLNAGVTHPILKRHGIELYQLSSGLWQQSNIGANVTFPNMPLAITGSGAIDFLGNKYPVTPAQNDAAGALRLANDLSADYGALAIRSFSVWNANYYNFETCVNIHNRMKNNTLI